MLITILFFVFPYYQYYVDPDATAYLTIAKRYANGDFYKAINGYWSPWSIWLTALLIKMKFAAFKAAIIVNAFGALCFLYVSNSLFKYFKLTTFARWILSITLSLFLVYAIFWQSFDDIWECFFLLFILRIIIRRDFAYKSALWKFVGFLAALAYFAKAYSLPFVVLEIFCLSYLVTQLQHVKNKKQWRKITVVTLFTMLLFMSPWLGALYYKYGTFMTSSAGSLNLSWNVVGHPMYKDGLHHLIAPIYKDSPYYWEDPFLVNAFTPQFWNSPHLLLSQIVRIGFNILKFIQSINELSMFFGVVIIAAFFVVFNKKTKDFQDDKIVIAALSFLLFPLGYFLINFESRYLWYMLPISMILGAVIIQNFETYFSSKKYILKVLIVVFALSFLVTPIMNMKKMYLEGQKEYLLAETLKKEGIQGSFTSSLPYSEKTQKIVRLAYFSSCTYYSLPMSVSKQVLLNDMRKYKVKYYFLFENTNDIIADFTDEYNQPLPEIAKGKLEGLRVFLVNP